MFQKISFVVWSLKRKTISLYFSLRYKTNSPPGLLSVCASLRVLEDGSDSVIQAELGRDITLACNYDLEEEQEVLYSIKWYRADQAGGPAWK